MKPLVDLVYPPRCPLCGAALADQDGLCVDCWSLLDIPDDGGGGEAAALWLEHGRRVPVHAATFYNEASRRLVLDHKHGRRIALARLLVRLIAATLSGPAHDGVAPLLVPVPLHRWRLWSRGFNQAALISAALTRVSGVANDPLLLRRVRATPPLRAMGAKARARAVAGVFRVIDPKAQLRRKSVVLIDDIYTSGATTDGCTAALLRAGAAKVTILCWARVLDSAD